MTRKKSKLKNWVITLLVFPLIAYAGYKLIDRFVVNWVVVSLDTQPILVHSAPSEKQTGDIELTSSSLDAGVLLNDRFYQQIPPSGKVMINALYPDTYTLQLVDGRQESDVTHVRVAAGEVSSVTLQLPAARPLAITPDEMRERPGPLIAPRTPIKHQSFPVTVEKEHFNAKILVNDKWVGNAPATIALPHGKNLLRIEIDGYFHEEMVSVPNKQQFIHVPSHYFKSI